MKISSIKLEQCDSTQTYLKDLLEREGVSSTYVVSTKNQTQGRGRLERTWEHYPNSLAFSFNFAPNRNHPLHLFPLTLGVALFQYFFENHQISLELKWPNDLIFEGKKVGGILTELTEGRQIIAGIGINVSQAASKYAFLELEYLNDFQHSFPTKFVHYFSENFLNLSKNTYKIWNKQCAHINKQTHVYTEKEIVTGKTTGISKDGRLLIQKNGHIHEFISVKKIRYVD